MIKAELKQLVFDEMAKDEDLEYADNFRFADVADTKELTEYNERLDKGCCGFYDRVIIDYAEDGARHIYLYGCNYGH